MDNTNEDTIVINKTEYAQLLRDQAILDALRAAGVDNWEWYGEALEGINALEE